MVRIKNLIKKLLHIEDTPERTALAYSIGIFLGFSPFLGFHTLGGIAVAFLFGLNRIAVLIGLFVNNPWTLVPYYTVATYLGGHLIGFPKDLLMPDFRWSHLLRGYFWMQLPHHWRVLVPMALGSTILAVLGAALTYPLALYAIKRGRAALSRQPAAENIV